MFLKVVLNRQIHLYRGQLTLKQLKQHCLRVFKSLPTHFQFYYIDEESDEITINSEEDINMLKQINAGAPFKIYIREIDEEFEVLGAGIVNPESTKDFDQKKNNKFALDKLLTSQEINQKRQQEQLINGCVSQFLDELNRKTIKLLEQEQQQIIHDEIENELENIMTSLENKLAQQEKKKKSIGVQNKRVETIDESMINKIVDKKIQTILPKIIKKVEKIIEQNNKCCKCTKINSSLQFERLINSELRKKLQKKERFYV